MNLDNTSHETFYELWKKGESTDLLVVVEGKEFKCHTAVLCACSDFFKAMMETKMKESQERVVHLGEISAETFSTVLESIYRYTEEVNLTNENVVDMWYASHQLQIKRVMQECEKFVTGEYLTVETCVSVFSHAEQLTATTTLNNALTFICRNFESLVKRESYLDTSYDNIVQIVQSEDLNINSEDSVIEFILKWVSYAPQRINPQNKSHPRGQHDQAVESGGDAGETKYMTDQNEGESMIQTCPQALPMSTDDSLNIGNSPSTSHSQEQNRPERVKDSEEQATERNDTLREIDVKPQKYPRATYLHKLLRSSRICLASKSVLENLLKHELVEEKELYKYVLDSLLYNFDVGRRHGSWAEGAVRRRSSGMKHVMMFVEKNSNNVMAYGLDEGSIQKWTTIPCDEDVVTANKSIAVFDNQLLVLLYIPKKCIQFKLHRSAWHTLETSVYCHEGIECYGCILAHENYIYFEHEVEYIYGYGRRRRYRYEHQMLRMNMITFPGDKPGHQCINLPGLGIMRSVISFRKYIIAFYEDSLGIYVIDTTSENRLKLNSIDGPIENIISFTAHDNTYILQRNGKMWKILLKDPAEKLKFESVANLWDFDWEIYGGIFYKSKLFIFGDAHSFQGEGQARQTSVPGVFENVQYVLIKSGTKCVPMVIQKMNY